MPDSKDFARELDKLAHKRLASISRHRERYIKAYCARFEIEAEDFGDYELVIVESWDANQWMHRFRMQKRHAREGSETT